jgi:hypothetical protein
MAWWTGSFLGLAMACTATGSGDALPPDPAATLRAIAADIEALGATRPQLAAFRADTHLDADAARIDYAWRTHATHHAGGWTAGVPNPDADGLWFHIDVHDPASTAQIHTQPLVERWCLGDAAVSFLILEGERTEPVAGALRGILESHGVRGC